MNSLIRIVRVIVRHCIFGVDAIVGLFAFTLLSLYFGEPPKLWNLFLAIAFAHLPDIDFVLFLPLRKRFGWVSHWIVGHHPWFYAIAIYIFASKVPVNPHWHFITTLLIVGVLAHFVHDSVQPQGMYWIYPFKWSRITFKDGIPRHPTEGEILRSEEAKLETSKADSAAQFERRKEEISGSQISVWCMAFGMALAFLVL